MLQQIGMLHKESPPTLLPHGHGLKSECLCQDQPKYGDAYQRAYRQAGYIPKNRNSPQEYLRHPIWQDTRDNVGG